MQDNKLEPKRSQSSPSSAGELPRKDESSAPAPPILPVEASPEVPPSSLALTTVEADDRFEKITQALAQADTLQETKIVLDAVEAIRIYSRRARVSAEIVARYTTLRIQAERKLGEKIMEAKAAGKLREGRPEKTIDDNDSFSLSRLGISPDASSRAQKLAAIPADEFEQLLLRNGEGGSLSIARILSEASGGRPVPPEMKTRPQKRKKARIINIDAVPVVPPAVPAEETAAQKSDRDGQAAALAKTPAGEDAPPRAGARRGLEAPRVAPDPGALLCQIIERLESLESLIEALKSQIPHLRLADGRLAAMSAGMTCEIEITQKMAGRMRSYAKLCQEVAK
jgi:hypothetical protein